VERSLQPQGSGAEDQAKKSLELMASALDEGNSLILFPEGTRGDGQEIGEFKSGMYYLWQRRPDVQFTPVFIHNLNRILPKGEVLPVPVISRILFGPPLTLAPDESKGSFLGKSRDALCALEKYVVHD
jgi:1-acyl-sn-glycerol-3-phosphate acyltransferase